MGFVSNLFNGQVLAVDDECEQCECLAQGKSGVEQFIRTIVFDLGLHTRCEVQVGHRYCSVAKDNKFPAVGFPRF
jgi:hypothetical protein